MKILRRTLLILFLLITLVYVTNITAIPDNILLFKGENLNLGTIFGIYIQEKQQAETIEASSTLNEYNAIERSSIQLSLFNVIPVKEIKVNTISNTKVIPLGNTIGLKLYTEGVLVVGMTEIEGKKPYENTGIEEGDMIIKINEKEISSTKELVECVNSCKGEPLEIKYLRSGEELETNISPAKTTSNEYKLGLWVRDGAARDRYSNIL